MTITENKIKITKKELHTLKAAYETLYNNTVCLCPGSCCDSCSPLGLDNNGACKIVQARSALRALIESIEEKKGKV